jgi:hypothetical protein
VRTYVRLVVQQSAGGRRPFPPIAWLAE